MTPPTTASPRMARMARIARANAGTAFGYPDRMAVSAAHAEFIRGHYLFAGLSDLDFDRIAANMTFQELAKGELLFLRGDPADAFFFVVSGQIELSLTSPGGNKKVIEVFTEGRTFAEAIAFMREHRYPVTSQALIGTELIRVPNDNFVRMLYDNPDACMLLLSNLCQHMHTLVTEIERISLYDAQERFCAYLLDLATTDGPTVTVSLDLPRHVLASKLSVKPETLSRILQNLQMNGTIQISGREVTIPDKRNLRRLGERHA